MTRTTTGLKPLGLCFRRALLRCVGYGGLAAGLVTGPPTMGARR